MNTDAFLSQVAQYILNKFPEKTGEITVVLPNKRGGLFLMRHLSANTASPLWAPEILSIEEFIEKHSGLQPADAAEQLILLYEIYCSTEGDKAESFDAFCKWAPTLLKDFDETESYLADTEKLFGNLKDIREIENWSLGSSELTDFQKQYIRFWDAIGIWYKIFRHEMLERKKSWPGLAYRIVAEKIKENGEGLQEKFILFAGFNALNAAEKKIFKVLSESGRAEILWDADRYYLEDTYNEAGRFLRQYKNDLLTKKHFTSFDFIHVHDSIAGTQKNITITGAARHISQARAAGNFLHALGEEKINTPETAVVLCDEQLLFPVLNALPAEVQHVNITMGFPLKNSLIHQLVNVLFRMHMNAQRFGIKTREGLTKYYHADIVALLRHPYIRFAFRKTNLTENALQTLVKKNYVFSSAKQLFPNATERTEYHQLLRIFELWNTPEDAVNALMYIIEVLREKFAEHDNEKQIISDIDTETLFQLSLIINRLHTIISQHPVISDLKSLKALIGQQLSSTTLPFFGEPLQGLQVMGVLESRTLDFKNLILVSANENILPAPKQAHSFIVHDLKKAFGLPLWNDRDAIFAYHFYRLIQRSENIFIIYNTDKDTFGNREKSRFVTQLQNELPLINKTAVITENIFDSGIPETDYRSAPIIIEKTPDVLTKLEERISKGLPPSLLNSYRKCSLQFYFRYIAEIGEAETVEETIGVDTLGTIIHETLEELYTPLLQATLTPELIKSIRAKAPETFEKIFADQFPGEESFTGKNLLAKNIARRYILRYLENEEQRVSRISRNGGKAIVTALEDELKRDIIFNGRTVPLKGKADRIDTENDAVVLLDYKTGKADESELKFKDWAELIDKPDLDKAFQLLMYAWLYADRTTDTTKIIPAIISFRNLNDGPLSVKPPGIDFLSKSNLSEFEKVLEAILEKFLDEHIAYSQTDNEAICKFCDFNIICRRTV